MTLSIVDANKITTAYLGIQDNMMPEGTYGEMAAGAAIIGGGISAFQGGAWLWGNRGNYASAWQQVRDKARIPQLLKEGTPWYKNIFTNNLYWRQLQAQQNLIPQIQAVDTEKYNKLSDNAKAKYDKKMALNNEKAKIYKTAQDKLNDIKRRVKSGQLKGAALKKELNELSKLIHKGDLEVYKQIKAGNPKFKAAGKWNKFMSFINRKSGMNWLNRQFLAMATKEGTTAGTKALNYLGKAGRVGMKFGGPLTFGIEMVTEVGNICDAFKLSKKQGCKQVGKSMVKAAAATAGFVVGMKAGAAIGTFIGGPAGTAVGVIVGGILGAIGGLFCKKAAKAAVGEDEAKIAQNKDRNKMNFALMMNKGKSKDAILKEIGSDLLTRSRIESSQTGNEQTSYTEVLNLLDQELKGRADLMNEIMTESSNQLAQLTQTDQTTASQDAIAQNPDNIFATKAA